MEILFNSKGLYVDELKNVMTHPEQMQHHALSLSLLTLFAVVTAAAIPAKKGEQLLLNFSVSLEYVA